MTQPPPESPDPTPPGAPQYPAYPGAEQPATTPAAAPVPPAPPAPPIPPAGLVPPAAPAGPTPYPAALGPAYPPTGQSPYPAPPTRRLASLRTPAILVTVFSVVVTLMLVTRSALAWAVQDRLTAIYEGSSSELTVLYVYDTFDALYALALLGAFVSTGIWLHRAHTQAQVGRPHRTSRSSGWAWGGWICPVVQLWFPFQVVRDASLDPIGTDRSNGRGWWWAMLLIAVVAIQVAGRIVSISETPNGFAAIGPSATIAAILLVIALALWMRVVWSITRDHAAAYAA